MKPVFKSISKNSHLITLLTIEYIRHREKYLVLPCFCGAVYMGETHRSIQPRLYKLLRYLKTSLLKHSALAESHHNTGHKMPSTVYTTQPSLLLTFP